MFVLYGRWAGSTVFSQEVLQDSLFLSLNCAIDRSFRVSLTGVFLALSAKQSARVSQPHFLETNDKQQAGCMGALNDGVTERCGRIRGVIHEMWIVDKSEHPDIEDLRVVGGEGLQVIEGWDASLNLRVLLRGRQSRQPHVP